jgi:rRNA maturation protein Nop10
MKQVCPKCSKEIYQTIPAKYSPEDKYAKYRRMAKEQA